VKERKLILSLLFRCQRVFTLYFTRYHTLSLNHSSLTFLYPSQSFLSSTLSLNPSCLSLFSFVIPSFSKLINDLRCDLLIILIIIHYLFILPSLYPFFMCLLTFTLPLFSSLLHTFFLFSSQIHL